MSGAVHCCLIWQNAQGIHGSLVVAARASIPCSCLEHLSQQQAQRPACACILWAHCSQGHSVLVPLPDHSLNSSWRLSLWEGASLMPLHGRDACHLTVQHLPP